MIIVLDTNVLIAAFISHGTCNEVFEQVIRHHKLVISEFILQEFQNKLVGKFNYAKKEVEEALHLLLSRSEVITSTPLTAQISRDPDDDNILAVALSGNRDCIVSGDKDILDLTDVKNLRLISPSYFWKYEAKTKFRN